MAKGYGTLVAGAICVIALFLLMAPLVRSSDDAVGANATITEVPVLAIISFSPSPTPMEGGNDMNFSIQVRNDGNALADDAILNITIYNASGAEMMNFVSSVASIGVGVTENISILHNMTLPVGTYTANATVDYNGTFVGPTSQNIEIAAGPLIYLNYCANLSIANTVYTLISNIGSNGNCINITSNNITLDCTDHMINFSKTTVDYGVQSNSSRTTIRNCTIVNGNNALGRYVEGVRLTSTATDSVVEFNNITVSNFQSYCMNSEAPRVNVTNNFMRYTGTLGSVFGSSGSDCLILNNNITQGGSDFFVVFVSGSNNRILGNFINSTSGNGGPLQIYATNSTVFNNTLFSHGSGGYAGWSAYGLWLAGAGINASGNTIKTYGQGDAYGAFGGVGTYVSGSNNRVFNNSIEVAASYGVYLASSSNNTFTTNNITSASSYGGVYLFSGSNNSNFTGNNITSVNGPGVLINSSSNNSFFSNNITSTNKFGAYLVSSSDNNFTSNNITGSNYGAYLQSSSNNTFADNNVGGGDGISLSSGSDNNFTSNNITSTETYGTGVSLSASSNNLFEFNNVTANSKGTSLSSGSDSNSFISNSFLENYWGVTIESSSDNNFTSNRITNTYYNGVVLTSSSGNKFTSNNITDSYGNAVHLSGSDHNTFISNNIAANLFSGSANEFGVELDSSDSNTFISNNITDGFSNGVNLTASSGNTFTNDVLTSAASDFYSMGSSGNQIINMTFNSTSFPTKASFTYSGDIMVDSTNAVLDQSPLQNVSRYLNITNSTAASVYLNASYPQPSYDERKLGMYRYDGSSWQLVPGSYADSIENIVLANFTEFSVFAPMANISRVYACENLANPDTTYVLMQDISSNSGTCFNVLANNVTLDCVGKSISFARQDTGYGVSSGGYNFTTVINCNFIKTYPGWMVSSSRAMSFSTGSYFNVSNNNVTFVGYGSDNYAFYLNGINHSIFTDIRISDSTSDGLGTKPFLGYNLNNDTMSNFTINTFGPQAGINLQTSNNNRIIGNYIQIDKAGSSSSAINGVYFSSGSNNTVSNNNISISGPASLVGGTYSYALYITSSPGNNITDNNLTGFNANGGSIRIDSSPFTVLSNNTLNTSGADSIALQLYGSSNSRIADSTLSTIGPRSSALIMGSSITNNCDVTGNNFTAMGPDSNGIYISAVSNSNFTENILASAGIDFSSSGNSLGNQIINMTFNSTLFPTAASFTYNGTIIVDSTDAVLDQAPFQNVSKYLNISNTTAAWVYMNISFAPQSYDERKLSMYRYNGSHWLSVPNSFVDTENNTVYANITQFSVFAPMADRTMFYACDNLTLSDTTYSLKQNVSSEGTCFNVWANNVMLDCNSYTINYSQSFSGNAVNITGYNFTTVKNCVMLQDNSSVSVARAVYLSGGHDALVRNNMITTRGSNSYGAYLDSNTRDSVFRNNTILTSGDSSLGIRLLSATNNTIANNSIDTTHSSTADGINIDSSNDNNISFNSINPSAGSGSGVFVSASSRNLIANNTIDKSPAPSGSGIYLSGGGTGGNVISGNTIYATWGDGDGVRILFVSNSNSILNNTIETISSTGYGINVYTSHNSVVSDNRITATGSPGKGIRVSSSSGNNFTGNNITATEFGSNAILLESGANSNKFTNDVVASNGIDFVSTDSSGNTLINMTFNSTSYPTVASFTYSGDIDVDSANGISSGTLSNISRYISISNSTGAWVFLNFSYDDPVTKESKLRMYRHDGSAWQIVPDSAVDTVNNVVYANISQFSVFAPMVDANALYDCQDLDEADTVYSLKNNVSNESTCFNIIAENVTLDCNSYTINYSGSAFGYGVNVTEYNNATVRNCNIMQTNPSITGAHAIYSSANHTAVTSSNITTNGQDSYGISLNGWAYNNLAHDIIVTDNTVLTTGQTASAIYVARATSSVFDSNNFTTTGSKAVGFDAIGIGYLGNSNITNNVITTTSTSGGNSVASSYGLAFAVSSGNLVMFNNISTSQSYAHGIRFSQCEYNNVTLNRIITQGGSGAYVSWNGGNTFDSNYIEGGSFDSGRIYLTASGNIIINNVLNATNGNGVYVTGGASSNTIVNNTIAAGASGVRIDQNGGSNNNISFNNITKFWSDYGGVYIQAGAGNYVIGNTITIPGPFSTNAYGVYLASSGNRVLNNNITTSTSEQPTIYLTSGGTNTVNGNKLITDGTNAHGIGLSSSSDNSLSNNNISTSGAGAFGINVLSSSRNNFTGNNITSTAYYGVRLISSSNFNTFTSNNITSSGTNTYGAYLSSSSNNTFTDNNITSNNGTGIYLESSSNCSMTDNIVTANAAASPDYGFSSYGIRLVSGSNNNSLISNNISASGGAGAEYYAGGHGYGVIIDPGSSGNVLTGNAVSVFGGVGGSGGWPGSDAGSGGHAYGVLINSSSDSNIITNNIVNATGGVGGTAGYARYGGEGGYGYGIFIKSSSTNRLTGNNISSIGADSGNGGNGAYPGGKSYGVLIESNSYSNILTDNIVSIEGGDSAVTEYSPSNGGASYGFLVQSGSDGNTIENNTVSGLSGKGGCSTHWGYYCTQAGSANGIYLSASLNSNITNNSISITGGIGAPGGAANGIYIESGLTSETLTRNTISATGGNGSSGTMFFSAGGTSAGIYSSGSSGNMSDNRITSQGGTAGDGTTVSIGYGISLGAGSNNNITNNSISSSGIDFASTGSSNNLIRNMTFSSTLFPTTASFTYSGDITVDSTDAVLDQYSLQNISKYLNVSNTTAASVSLNISYPQPSYDERKLGMYRYDGSSWQLVPGSYADSIENIVLANFTEFSVFAPMADLSEVFQCENLDIADSTYILMQNVSDADTCFNLLADNVTLDCGGYTINYSQISQGNGVNLNGHDLITVRNCNIVEGAFSGESQGIFGSGAGDVFTNNTISTNGVGANAIHGTFTGSIISGNNLTTTSSSVRSIFLWAGSNNNNVTDNTIYSNQFGIHLDASAGPITSNTLTGNSISISGNDAGGISSSSASGNSFSNNTITTNGIRCMGMLLSNSSDNSISDSNFTTFGDNSHGIYLSSPGSNNNSINSTNIVTHGLASYGVYAYFYELNNSFADMNITTYGDQGTGIDLYDCRDCSIEGINITTNGDNAAGINLVIMINDSVVDADIATKGSNSHGIQIVGTGGIHDTHVIGSNIDTAGDNSFGVLFSTGNNPTPDDCTFTNNAITTHGNNAYGINANAQNASIFTTISGNAIVTGGNGSHAVYFQNNVNGTVTGNNITTTGDNGAQAVRLEAAPGSTVSRNTIITGTGAVSFDAFGVYVTQSNDTVVSDNTINTTGQYGDGIRDANGGLRNTYRNNTITVFADSSAAAGIRMYTNSNNSLIELNNITLYSQNSSHSPGVWISDGSSGITVQYNTINHSGNGNGVYVSSGSDDQILYNNITTNSSCVYFGGVYRSAVSGNILIPTGQSSSGLSVDASTSYSNFTSNTIELRANRSVGVSLMADSSNNRFERNNITGIAPADNYALTGFSVSSVGAGAENNTITGNLINLSCNNSGSGGNNGFGMNIYSTTRNTNVTNNTVIMSGNRSSGIAISGGNDVLARNNSVNIEGIGSTGISLGSVNGSDLADNVVFTNCANPANTYCWGIQVSSGSNGNSISGNNISTSNVRNHGLQLNGAVNNSVSGNTIAIAGLNSHAINLIFSSSGNNFTLNVINVSENNSNGIGLTSSSNNRIEGNNLTSYGQSGSSAILLSGSNDSYIGGNGINSTGINSFGIYLFNSKNLTATYNDISTYANSSHGILASGGAGSSLNDSVLSYNTITIYGNSSGIVISSRSNNITADSNNITMRGTFTSTSASGRPSGIVVTGLNNNSVTNNIIALNETAMRNRGIIVAGSGAGSAPVGTQVINNTVTSYANDSRGVFVGNCTGTIATGNMISVTADNSYGFGIGGTSGSANSSVLTGNDINVSGGNGYGLWIGTGSSNNSVSDSTVMVGGGAYGVYITASSNNNLTNILVKADSIDFTSTGSSLNNRVANMMFNSTAFPTTASFNYSGEIQVDSAVEPPTGSLQNVSKYLNFTNTSAGASVDLNISYSDSGLSFNENKLRMFRFNGSDWQFVPGSAVDAGANLVRASINSFSVFAPLADIADPTVSIESPQARPYNHTMITLNYTSGDNNAVEACTYEVDLGGVLPLPGCSNTTFLAAAEGPHSVTVYVNDSTGNAVSSIIAFTVDLTHPLVDIQVPANMSYNVTYVGLSYNVSDDKGVDKCQYSRDGGARIDLPACGNTTLLGFTETSHNVTVYVNDTAGNEDVETVWFIMDFTAPSLLIHSPGPNSYVNTTIVEINFTANTETINYTNMSIRRGASLIDSVVRLSEGYFTVNLNSGSEGVFNISGMTWDVAGNSYIAVNENVTVDTTYPLISGLYSNDSDNVSRSDSTMNYTVTASDTNLLIVTLNGTQMARIGATDDYSVAKTPAFFGCVSDGPCILTAAVLDKAGWSNTTAYLVTVDNTIPAISGLLSNDTDSISRSDVTLNFTVNSGDSHLLAVSLNGTPMADMGGGAFSAISTAAALGCVPDSTCLLTATAVDEAGNSNTTDYMLTIDETNPAVSNLHSSDSDNISRSDAALTFTVTSSDPHFRDVKLNGTAMANVGGNSYALASNASYFGCVSDGPCVLTANATDMADNFATTNYTMHVDDTAPAVTLTAPIDNLWTMDNINLQFKFRFTDPVSPTASCTLYVDGVAHGSNGAVVNNTETALLLLSALTDARHYWNVSCTDLAGNSNTGVNRSVNIGSFCADLNTENLTYVLTHDVSSTDTCTHITANNVTLDCNGYRITYAQASAGYGAIVDGANLATIKRCIFVPGNGAVTNASAISLNYSDSSRVLNNTIAMSIDNSHSIELKDTNHSLFENNLINITGYGDEALNLVSSSHNRFIINNISLSTLHSAALSIDPYSINNTFINNTIRVNGSNTFPTSVIADPIVGANAVIPDSDGLPIVTLIIPPGSVPSTTMINVTVWFGNMGAQPTSTGSRRGHAAAYVNITTSQYVSTNDSNPYIMIINHSSLNLNDVQSGRLDIFLFSNVTNMWEPLGSTCDLTNKTCTAMMLHFSQYALIVKIPAPAAVSEAVVSQQLPLSVALSCTKEFADVTTAPDASVDVVFLDSPYANLPVKSGIADSDGIFSFLADLAGSYKVTVSKSGLLSNELTIIASDECVPRITFARKMLECTGSPCRLDIPVITTRMKDVVVDLSDVTSIITGSASVIDKFGGPFNRFSYIGEQVTFPLVTDRFSISFGTTVGISQSENVAAGTISTVLTHSGAPARVSGITVALPQLGKDIIKNITLYSPDDGTTSNIAKYYMSGGKLTIDQQLWLPSNAVLIVGHGPAPLTCQVSADCPFDSSCRSGTCVQVQCACGYPVDHACVPYECCADKDCGAEKSCISHICIYTPPTITPEEKAIIAGRLDVLIANIQVAKQEGQDVASAEQLLSDAKKAYEAGDFDAAQQLLAQAQQILTAAREARAGVPAFLIAAVAAVAVTIVAAVLIFQRLAAVKLRRTSERKPEWPITRRSERKPRRRR